MTGAEDQGVVALGEVWALLHLGALGARSSARRQTLARSLGFDGSLALQSSEATQRTLPDDWRLFDIVSVDAHRSKEVAHIHQKSIRALVAQGKPVAITEFGCTTHRGAADHGARGGPENSIRYALRKLGPT